MNQTNILTGLNVTTQVPLDVKKEVVSINELINFTSDSLKPYGYYRNMQVRDLTTGKTYTWKPYTNDTNKVSEKFTYPDNLIVHGINYSLQPYAFYEDIWEVPDPEPTPTGNTINTRLVNKDYTSTDANDKQARLVAGHGESMEGDMVVTTYSIRPIASRTLKVFNPPTNVGWGGSANTAVPLRIELYPPEAVIISDDPEVSADYPTINDLVNDVDLQVIEGPKKVILLPGKIKPIASHTGKAINWSTDLKLADDLVLVASTPLFKATKPNTTIKLDVPKSSVINLTSSLASLSSNANLSVSGKGLINANTSSSIVTTGVLNGVTNQDVSMTFEDVTLHVENGSLLTMDNNTTASLNNVNITTSAVSGYNLFNVDNSSLNIKNSNANLNLSGGDSLANLSNNANLNINSLDVSGVVGSIASIAVEDTPSIINVNNSTFDNTVFTNVISSNEILPSNIASNFKINNTSFNALNKDDEAFKVVNVSNVTTNTKEIRKVIPSFLNRDRARIELEVGELFINTNNDDKDTNTHKIDVVI